MTRVVDDVAFRSYDMELRSADRAGRRLVGTVAVFNSRTRIPDRNGDFEEQMLPGFAARSLRENGMPTMMWDHGKDPRTGTVPIGVFESFEETRRGYEVEGELFDNQLVEPIRQAIAGKAVRGMSFRFKARKDKWERRSGRDGIDLRHVIDADVHEAGPVAFPAYRDTSVSVRSLLATYSEEQRAEMLRELAAMAGISTDLTGDTSRGDVRGESGTQPREGDAPTPAQQHRALQLRLLRDPIVLP